MALSKNKPRHAFGNAKIYFFAKFHQNIPNFRTISCGKTANGGEPNALHVSYQRPSKREPPRFARRLKISSCSRATGTSKSIFQLGLKWHQIISNLFRTLNNVIFGLTGLHFDAWGLFLTWNWETKKFPVARVQLERVSRFSSWA